MALCWEECVWGCRGLVDPPVISAQKDGGSGSKGWQGVAAATPIVYFFMYLAVAFTQSESFTKVHWSLIITTRSVVMSKSLGKLRLFFARYL